MNCRRDAFNSPAACRHKVDQPSEQPLVVELPQQVLIFLGQADRQSAEPVPCRLECRESVVWRPHPLFADCDQRSGEAMSVSRELAAFALPTMPQDLFEGFRCGKRPQLDQSAAIDTCRNCCAYCRMNVITMKTDGLGS